MPYEPNFPPPPEDPLGTPPPPPVSSETPLAVEVTEGTGLPRNIAAALACIFPLIGGIIFYVLDRRDRFVRAYALQSIVLGAFFFVLGIVLRFSTWFFSFIPLLGGVFVRIFGVLSGVMGLVFMVLWLILIYKAYRGVAWELPVLWRFAKRHIPQTFQ